MPTAVARNRLESLLAVEADIEKLFELVRQMCLAHPDACERSSHGSPAFFVEKGGQFAALWDNHHGDGNRALLVAAAVGVQESLIASDPEVFYRPPYFGPSGWIGVRLDHVTDWNLVEELVAEGYRLVEAKKRRPRRKGPGL